MEKDLRVVLILGEYELENQGYYYLPENLLIGTIDPETELFTDFLTGKKFMDITKASDSFINEGYANPISIKEFKKRGKFSKEKLDDYWKKHEKLVYVFKDDETLYGLSLESFEQLFETTLDIVYTDTENKFLEDLASGNISEVLLALASDESETPETTEDLIEKKLDKPIGEIVSKIKENIINQDEAVKKLVVAIYRHFWLKDTGMKSNILMYGPSGCGKTALIKEISKVFDIPVWIEDMTQFTAPGYKGKSAEDILMNLYKNAGEDLEKAERSILFLDEIDKKAGKNGEEGITKSDVLTSLLKIIEGGIFNLEEENPFGGISIQFDTSKLLVIAGGAFTDLYKGKVEEKKNGIGFGANVDTIDNKPAFGSKLEIDDFEKFGIPLEFIGRFKTIIRMNTLTEENLKQILKESNLSALKNYVKIFENKGIKLDIPEELYNKIVKIAYKHGTGARSLNIVVDNLFEEILYDIFDGKNTNEIEISENIIEDRKAYTLKRKIDE